MLLKVISEGPPPRAQLSEWRFAWFGNRTDWYKIKDLEKDLALAKKTSDAIDTMQNILMSFEEYMNIMDIDNQKAETAQHGMRIRHGTEVLTARSVGIADLRTYESAMANQSEIKGAPPRAMADRVWRDKLAMLLRAYLGTYGA
jgi:hypothetical protein